MLRYSLLKKTRKKSKHFLSCIKNNQTLGSLLVHDPVAALPAPNGIPRSDLILTRKQNS